MIKKNIGSMCFRTVVSILFIFFHTQIVFAQKSKLDSLNLLIKSTDLKIKCKAYFDMGDYYQFKTNNNFDLALRYYLRGLEIGKKESNSYKTRILNRIGLIYIQINDYTSALEIYTQILSLTDTTKDFARISNTYNNMGMIYVNLKKWNEAIKYFQLTKKYAILDNNKEVLASANGNFGTIYIELKKYKEALVYLFQANEYYAKTHAAGLAGTEVLIGKALMKLNQYHSAKEHLEKSLRIGLDKQYHNVVYESYKCLAELSVKTNEQAMVAVYYQKSLAYKDSLTMADASIKVGKVLQQYFINAKDKEILILKQEVEINKLKVIQRNILLSVVLGTTLILAVFFILYFKQKQLKKERKTLLLEQKILRLQMNPHFLSNALTAIQKFIYAGDKMQAVKLIADFSSLTRNILENSREEYVSLKEEVAFLTSYLELQKVRFPDKFNYNIQVQPDFDLEEVILPPMIGQPFVENAIEHGIRYLDRNGEISVCFSGINENLMIEIRDNGNGIGQTTIVEKKSSDHKSLSTKITRERLAQLSKSAKTELVIEPIHDEFGVITGTYVKIAIPLKLKKDDLSDNH